MAIAPTGDIYKALSFDNVSSRTYGVYITGSAVYNAPEREVEMISIPGRNGQFALDKGRFENIEVTYPAGIFADNEADFADAISEFRNFLCSRKGYVRLQDEYNPNEYRMAIYKSGLEVEPTQLKAGEFEITFDCKPQRFLTSGEVPITGVALRGFNNPTQFSAHPLLAVYGYGNIIFSATSYHKSIQLNNETYGEMVALPASTNSGSSTYNAPYSMVGLYEKNKYTNGDSLTLAPSTMSVILTAVDGVTLTSATVQSSTGITGATYDVDHTEKNLTVKTSLPQLSYAVDTAKEDTHTLVLTVSGMNASNTTVSQSLTIVVTATNESTGQFRMSIDVTSNNAVLKQLKTYVIARGIMNGVSTKSILGNPTYIDCETGQVYKIENNKYISLNRYVDLGADLPEIRPAANSVTLGATYNSAELTPRWWKI